VVFFPARLYKEYFSFWPLIYWYVFCCFRTLFVILNLSFLYLNCFTKPNENTSLLPTWLDVSGICVPLWLNVSVVYIPMRLNVSGVCVQYDWRWMVCMFSMTADEWGVLPNATKCEWCICSMLLNVSGMYTVEIKGPPPLALVQTYKLCLQSILLQTLFIYGLFLQRIWGWEVFFKLCPGNSFSLWLFVKIFTIK
jgi:hypothetical protein